MVDTSIVNAFHMHNSFTYAFPDGTGPDRPHLDAMLYGYSAGHRLYETSHGWLMLAVKTEAEWSALQGVLAARGDDISPLNTPDARNEADGPLAALIRKAFFGDTAAAWFAALDAAGVPVEIVDDTFGTRLHDDPTYKDRNWVVSFPHDLVGRIDQIGMLCDLSETPGRVSRSPLIVGDSTREIMGELGFDTATIDEYVAANVVSDVPIPAFLRKLAG